MTPPSPRKPLTVYLPFANELGKTGEGADADVGAGVGVVLGD